MTLKEVQNKLASLKKDIKNILKDCDYLENGDLSAIDCDTEDPEVEYMARQALNILEKLDRVELDIEYMGLPVKVSGKLHLKENGRYSIGSYELTSGDDLEVLVYQELFDCYMWFYSRIEHNGKSYYLVNHEEVELEGLTARKRGK